MGIHLAENLTYSALESVNDLPRPPLLQKTIKNHQLRRWSSQTSEIHNDLPIRLRFRRDLWRKRTIDLIYTGLKAFKSREISDVFAEKRLSKGVTLRSKEAKTDGISTFERKKHFS